MNWKKLEPVMVRVYQQSLSQSEVDAMTAFYRTPAGQAVMKKMPLIMQNSMHEMQGVMQEMMPRIQAVAKDSAEKLKKAGETAPPGTADPAKAEGAAKP